ncbi:NOG1 family protein [Halanaeroarchaeum sulfurireducens]|uniref:GTP-binding protein n=1 Tax=Halanaeroarchaeum sulfurireducens TaxID=1604004 RepID=A0A0F7P9N0_9EURY|nr:NOG1 family protein [Halanaeroarchaeum sulfurireducens]AKH96915.1 GTP-binding protein [Halanaeroarchaeum sulfurireducens]ALG81317.1 GTP-binding protein [Halanaeroarchaeum sulfurireducens]
MIFEGLPTTPTSEELLDKAFSRAARAGRAKHGVEAQESMLQTASNILSDNLENVVTAWPDFETVDPFYYEIADAIVDVDELRQHLSQVSWASRKTHDLGREYMGKLPHGDTDHAIAIRKQGFARMGSVLDQVEDDLAAISEARDALKTLPDIRPDHPTVVVAGYPNVGKTAFVNEVTNARNETAAYPFTTKGVHIGHVERDHIRYQLVDTPGLLDRPAAERNDIESQAVSALTHVGDVVLYVYDASESCGYELSDQRALHAEIESRFDVPVLTVCNKADRSMAIDADLFMAIPTHADDEDVGDGVDAVLDAVVEAIGHEPEIPFDG